jgi:hypothetical protein
MLGSSCSSWSLHSLSPQSSLGASLKPTVSMLDEFEVEGLLGECIPRSDSTQTTRLSQSVTDGASDPFQPCPLTTTSRISVRNTSTHSLKGRPLSRLSSTATTVLEFPNGPTDPSYGTLDASPSCFSGSDFESVGTEFLDDGSWIDTAQELGYAACPTSDMTFRCPLPDEYDSDDNSDMKATIVPSLLTYLDSNDSISSDPSATTSDTPLSSGGFPRKRIWESRPDEYVPRPKGAPAQSVASVLEIGMQWEREQQGGSKGGGNVFANAAIGRIRRVHGDAQYMN